MSEKAREIVERLWWQSDNDPGATAWEKAIATALAAERAKTLEEAATVAEEHKILAMTGDGESWNEACDECAAAIRALKD